MIPRYVRRAIRFWSEWRFKKQRTDRRRKLVEAVPEFAALSAKRDVIARQHRSGARAIDMQKRRVMTERLRAELGM